MHSRASVFTKWKLWCSSPREAFMNVRILVVYFSLGGHTRQLAEELRVAMGADLEEIRAALIAPRRRPARYTYACPGCGITVPRQKKGTWSCGRCSPRFDERFVLRLITP